jgi:hypothetical protein
VKVVKAGLKFFKDKDKRKTLSVLPDKAAESVESSFRVCRCFRSGRNPEDSRVQGSCRNRELLSQEIAK